MPLIQKHTIYIFLLFLLFESIKFVYIIIYLIKIFKFELNIKYISKK